MSDVIAYIDGFNLYNGIHSSFGRRYLWLDLQALCASFLLRGQRLVRVNYFTAPVRGQPASYRRQQSYWKALAAACPSVAIHRGHFQRKTLQCRACGVSWHSYEEKETDVSIAVSVVEDASRGAFATALVVSADGDLCPALRAVRRLDPHARVVAAFPPGRRSDDLRAMADATFTISRRKLASALLPPAVKAADGRILSRPAGWG